MRLKEDRHSWRAGGIIRRDFRHDPGLPETEVPRHRPKNKKNRKHVHQYKRTVVYERTVTRRRYVKGDRYRATGESYETTTFDVQYYCEGCGNRRIYRGY